MAAPERKLTKKSVGKDYDALKTKATKIAEVIGLVRKLYEFLDPARKELGKACIGVFLKDLAKGTLNGNHVIETKYGPLTVNFRLAEGSDISHYEATLLRAFPDDFEKIFEEHDHYEPTSTQATRRKQFEDHPELFTVAMRKKTPLRTVTAIVNRYPEAVDLVPRDPKEYAEVYPQSVDSTRTIYPRNGFIEKLSRKEDNLRVSVLKVLSKFFQLNLETAVKF